MTLPHFDNPRNEAQKLLNLQYEYKNGRAEALGEMYKMLFVIAYKTVNKKCSSDENVAGLSAAERQQKAHDATTYVIEQYLKRPDFVIQDSIIAYVYRRILRELYYARECDKMLVFKDELPESAQVKPTYEYIVTDTVTGIKKTYSCAGELYLNTAFKNLSKKQLVECIRNGTTWKNYTFQLLVI